MDKKTNLQNAGSFEDLLLDMMLEESKTKSINKSIDMNANNLFNNTATVALPASARLNFITQYPQFKASWLTRMNIFRLFIAVSTSIMILLYFVATNQPEQQPPKSKSFIPIVEKNDTTRIENQSPVLLSIHEADLSLIKNAKQIELLPSNDTTRHINNKQADTENRKLKPVQQRVPKQDGRRKKEQTFDEDLAHLITSNSNMDGIEIGEFRPILERLYIREPSIIPFHPVIHKITPRHELDDYRNKQAVKAEVKDTVNREAKKQKSKVLNGVWGDNKYMAKKYPSQDLFTYTGIPFKKGFDHMMFFSDHKTVDKLPFNNNLESLKPQRRPGFGSYNPPYAMRFYDFEMQSDSSYLQARAELLENTCMRPFYISKTEVSNKDYKEFIWWVLKYNGYNNFTSLVDSTLPAEAYNYTFFNENSEYVQTKQTSKLNILPKQDCWTADFNYSYNQPMSNAYLTHPAYNDYPVVGVSYWQSLAFTDWLTWIWQDRFDQNNVPYEIEYDLPYDYEREAAVVRYLSENNEKFEHPLLPSDFLSNLSVKRITDTELRRQLNIYSFFQYINNLYTKPVSTDDLAYTNKSDIRGLENNVSEWCKEDYEKNWTPWRNSYKQLLQEHNGMSDRILIDLEAYFDSTCNNKNGKLVRGGSWVDVRVRKDAVNILDGAMAKAFVDPDEQRSAIGFRFVMRVKLKDEELVKLKVKTLGIQLPNYNYSNLIELPASINQHEDMPKDVNIKGAQVCETTNLSWWLFLNYLIDENQLEVLEKCIPNDPSWAIKMVNETEPPKKKNFTRKLELILPFPKSFIKDQQIDELPVSRFARKPVVGISHEAALLYCDWLNTLYKSINKGLKFGLPSEEEYKALAWDLPGGSSIWADSRFPRNCASCYTSNVISVDHYDTIDFANPHFEAAANKQLRDEILEQTPSTFRIALLDSLIDGKMSYQQFLDSQNSGKSGRFPIGINNTNLETAAWYLENEFGLFDLSGNASEMITDKTKTKGGSFASPATFININNSEQWNGEPSPCVGFRVILK